MQMGQTENARKYLIMSANSSKAYTQISAYDCLYFLEKDIDNFEEAIVYHELADSITNAMEELNSRELIASLQKKYENEKLRNDNLQMKVRYTNFIPVSYTHLDVYKRQIKQTGISPSLP